MKRKLLVGLLLGIPLIFHAMVEVMIRPLAFSQLGVIFFSLAVILAFSKLPNTVRFFYIWCLVTVFTSTKQHYSTLAFMFVTLFILIYKLMLSMERKDLRYCFEIIAIVCSIQAFWVVAQFVNVDFLMNVGRKVHMTFGTVGNPNLTGAMFLFCLVPMYFYKKWSIILPTIGIYHSQASASIYALAGGLLFYLMFSNIKPKRLLVLFIIFLIVCGLSIRNPIEGTGNGRFPMWGRIIELVREDKTFIGQGLGTFQFEFHPKYRDSRPDREHIRWRKAHNTYLQVLREQGMIGAFLLCLIPFALFVNFLRKKKTETRIVWMSGVVIVCLNAMGNFPDRNFTLMLYLLFTFACYRRFCVDIS